MFLSSYLGPHDSPERFTLHVAIIVFLASIVYGCGWVIPRIIHGYPDGDFAQFQGSLFWAVYHFGLTQMGIFFLMLWHWWCKSYLVLRAYIVFLALLYPLISYLTHSCDTNVLSGAFIWGLPLSFAFFLCGGSWRALKVIWGIHFATIVLFTSLVAMDIWHCSPAVVLVNRNSSSSIFSTSFMFTLVPQAICVIILCLCHRQYMQKIADLNQQIQVAEVFVDLLAKFDIEEASSMTLNTNVVLQRRLLAVLDQLCHIRPHLPHTLFVPDNDSHDEHTIHNPLEISACQSAARLLSRMDLDRCDTMQFPSVISGDPALIDEPVSGVPSGLEPKKSVKRRLRLDRFLLEGSNSFSPPGSTNSPSPIARTPGGRRLSMRRMSMVTTYEPESQPENPFAFEADREFLDAVSRTPDTKPPSVDTVTPKRFPRSFRSRRRFSSKISTQLFQVTKELMLPEKRRPKALDSDIVELTGVEELDPSPLCPMKLSPPPASSPPFTSKKASAMSPMVHSGLQQRTITLMYINLSNVNQMAKQYCSQIETLLDATTVMFFDVVTKNRGTVVHFSGGRLLAAWNTASRIPNHAQKACCCAIQIHEELNKMAGLWTKFGIQLSARIGITTCPATFGHIGRLYASYNVLGGGIAVAQALEQLCKRLKVRTLVTEMTHDLANFVYVMRPVDVIEIAPPGCRSMRTKVYELQGLSMDICSGDEWMYELKSMDLLSDGDYDRAFDFLCKGDLLGAQLLFSMQKHASSEDHTVQRLLALCEYFYDHEEGKRQWPGTYVRKLQDVWQHWTCEGDAFEHGTGELWNMTSGDF